MYFARFPVSSRRVRFGSVYAKYDFELLHTSSITWHLRASLSVKE